MYTSKLSPRHIAVALVAATMTASAAVSAAGQCKGLQQDACTSAAECLWIDGNVRKDGRSVSSHCKTRSRGKTGDQAAAGKAQLGQVR